MLKYNKFGLDPYGAHVKIVKFVGAHKKVLEIGCATGSISKRLKKNGCEIIGVEIDSDSAQLAKKYCQDVIVGDVESMRDIPYPEKYFDVILLSDVLEHLKSPLDLLRKLRKYLEDDGCLVVSIPNVANWKIRLGLLLGKFDYEDCGILDRTHLRFFNEKGARKLLENARFEIIKFDITPSILFPFVSKRVKYLIAKIRPNIFAFQFLMVGKKKKFER